MSNILNYLEAVSDDVGLRLHNRLSRYHPQVEFLEDSSFLAREGHTLVYHAKILCSKIEDRQLLERELTRVSFEVVEEHSLDGFRVCLMEDQ